MRILLVSTGSGSRGGGEIFLLYLAQGLSSRGHEVFIWIPQHERMNELASKCAGFGKVIRSPYVNTYDHAARTLSTWFNGSVSRRIAAEWKELKPDLIHISKQNLEDGLDLLRAVQLSGIPSVCTIHITQSARFLRAKGAALRDWIARVALLKYDGIIVAVQESRRAELAEMLDGKVRTTAIWNGVPLPDGKSRDELRKKKREELGLKETDFLILDVGRLVKQKDPLLFLQTAKQLHLCYPATRFLWVGEGNLVNEWNEWIAKEGLSSVISCTGWQSDVLPFLTAGDLMLHLAEYEGLPLAVIEAMAVGLPCALSQRITSEISLFQEDTVLFFQDPATLAMKLGDRAGLNAVAGAAKKIVHEHLSLEKMVDKYEHLYHEASAN